MYRLELQLYYRNTLHINNIKYFFFFFGLEFVSKDSVSYSKITKLPAEFEYNLAEATYEGHRLYKTTHKLSISTRLFNSTKPQALKFKWHLPPFFAITFSYCLAQKQWQLRFMAWHYPAAQHECSSAFMRRALMSMSLCLLMLSMVPISNNLIYL